MKSIKSILTIFFAVCALAISAQNNPYGDNYRDDSNRNGSRRFARRCTESFPARSFNRDYAGLSNANYFHLDKELRDYTKSRCLTSEQIRRLALLLPTDREKYDYLTYGLAHVFDIENYSLAGAVLANRNARDGFYRFLVREGVPAGDYYNDPYFAGTGNGYAVIATPQYDRYGNVYNNNNNYGNNNSNYNRNNNNSDPNYNNDAFNHPWGKEYKRNDDDNRGRNNNNTYDNNRNDDYNGQAGINSGYRGLMTYKEFELLKDRIKQNTFEKGKLETAKSLTRENVLTSNQIAEITRMLNFDNNRLDYAKFAYDYAYDRENFTSVSDAMSFDKSRKELQKYVAGQRK
jgi:hypothetical protein